MGEEDGVSGRHIGAGDALANILLGPVFGHGHSGGEGRASRGDDDHVQVSWPESRPVEIPARQDGLETELAVGVSEHLPSAVERIFVGADFSHAVTAVIGGVPNIDHSIGQGRFTIVAEYLTVDEQADSGFICRSEDGAEGRAAFKEKRTPDFKGR